MEPPPSRRAPRPWSVPCRPPGRRWHAVRAGALAVRSRPTSAALWLRASTAVRYRPRGAERVRRRGHQHPRLLPPAVDDDVLRLLGLPARATRGGGVGPPGADRRTRTISAFRPWVDPAMTDGGQSRIDQMLADARSQLQRVDSRELAAE